MANICVFCGARDGVDQKYVDAAFEFGKLLAIGKHKLIYGGGVSGIMGSTMRGAVSGGGSVLGIIPSFLMNKERSDKITESGCELIITESMDERKKILFARSDIIVILPGGIGTMDEFFEAITLKQLKQIDIKIGILNIDGFYDSLIRFIREMYERGFIKEEEYNGLFVVAESPQELFTLLSL